MKVSIEHNPSSLPEFKKYYECMSNQEYEIKDISLVLYKIKKITDSIIAIRKEKKEFKKIPDSIIAIRKEKKEFKKIPFKIVIEV